MRNILALRRGRQSNQDREEPTVFTGLQIPQNNLRVEKQSRQNYELTLTLELEANFLKCHTETASVFVVCLEDRLLRTLDSVRQNTPAGALDYDGFFFFFWEEMPSGFVQQSASGHILATTSRGDRRRPVLPPRRNVQSGHTLQACQGGCDGYIFLWRPLRQSSSGTRDLSDTRILQDLSTAIMTFEV